MHALLPQQFGRYRVRGRIAAGGMGAVYLAEEQTAGGIREVALKVLHEHHREDTEINERFLTEGRVGQRIVHPHVVPVLDAGVYDGVPYLALAYVRGTTLSVLIKRARSEGRRLPDAVTVTIMLDVLAGLQAAHDAVDDAGQSLGIVHRDVSPQNVLLNESGDAFLTDFGVAKVKDQLRATRSGMMIGKTGYMAPEQVLGRTIDPRTDLYAIGVMLWECFTGERLVAGFEAQMSAALGNTPAPTLVSKRPDLSPELGSLVDSLLALDANSRPASAREVVRRLRALVPAASREDLAAEVALVAAPLKLFEIPGDGDVDVHVTVVEHTKSTVVRTTKNEASGPTGVRGPLAVPVDTVKPARHTLLYGTAALVLGAAALALIGRGMLSPRPSEFDTAPPSNATAAPTKVEAVTEQSESAVSSVAAVASAPHEAMPAPNPSRTKKKTATAPIANSASRTTPPATTVNCDPPYVLQGGVRHYKRECFSGTGH